MTTELGVTGLNADQWVHYAPDIKPVSGLPPFLSEASNWSYFELDNQLENLPIHYLGKDRENLRHNLANGYRIEVLFLDGTLGYLSADPVKKLLLRSKGGATDVLGKHAINKVLSTFINAAPAQLQNLPPETEKQQKVKRRFRR